MDGSDEFHVRPQRHRVVPLEERVEELVDRDRALFLVPFPEIVPLEHPRHRHLCGDTDHLLYAQRRKPLGVEPDLGPRRIEDLENLLLVGDGVPLHVVSREGLSRLGLARRVSDHSGEVPDQEDHPVASVLEVLELLDEHRVPEVQVRRGGVEARLHPQGALLSRGRGDFPGKLLPGDHLHRASPQGLENVVHVSLLLICDSDTRNACAATQRPVSGSRSKNTPDASGSPEATSKRTGTWRRNRRRTVFGSMPMTDPAGPHIPASVMQPVPPGRTEASEVCTCVCVPAIAETLPSRYRASARFSEVASAWKSTTTQAASRRIPGSAASAQRNGQS